MIFLDHCSFVVVVVVVAAVTTMSLSGNAYIHPFPFILSSENTYKHD